MGIPNPDYDDDGSRTESLTFTQLEKSLSEDLHLVVGEEITDVTVQDESIVVELTNSEV